MLFRQIFDPDLAQYSYLVGCQKTGQALVIDPERDVDRYVEIAAAEDLEITAVAETHIHADFLSGAREFARRGVRVYLSEEGGDDWQSEWARNDDGSAREGIDAVFLRDGDTFEIGNIELRAVHSPGHTPEHLSYVITDRGGGAETPLGIATGDFVFVGDLGRPDLLESAAGAKGAMRPAAEKLFESLPTFLSLDGELQVWPGHGAGSSCGKALGAVPMSTVGYERRYNEAIQKSRHGEREFVDFILDAQPEPPLYFARMKKQNRGGPPLIDAVPKPEQVSVQRALELTHGDAEAVIVDTRKDRTAFLERHIRGALFAPIGPNLAAVAGSYVEEGTPVILVTESRHVERATRALVRIGLDEVVGWVPTEALDDAPESAVGSIPTTDFGELADLDDSVQILDVRKASEYREEHLPDAVNIAHTRLAEHLDELPRSKTLYVHCASGQRASFAASELAREGFEVVHVDDEFENATGTVEGEHSSEAEQ